MPRLPPPSLSPCIHLPLAVTSLSMPPPPNTQPPAPSPQLIQRTAEMLGHTPHSWRPAPGGWTLAQRWIVQFPDRPPAFLKIAVNPLTALWLRAEHKVYTALSIPSVPRLLGFSDDGRQPILALEDLSHAAWPPPWTARMVQSVLLAMADVRCAIVPLRLVNVLSERQQLMRWRHIARNPAPFLSLKLCTPAWLEKTLPRLIEAEAAAILDGNDFLHGDLKTGNICFRDGQCLLIDWNWACRGNGLLDIVTWLPGLHQQGGPPPQSVLPSQGALAALMAGYTAFYAAQPDPPQVPNLRLNQLNTLKYALPWVCHELALPLPDLLPTP